MSVVPRVVPDSVQRKAWASGAPGRRWLAGLDAVVAELERLWGVRCGPPLGGGSGAYVAGAVTRTGDDVVLKIAIPDGLEGHGRFQHEFRTLRLAAGRGCVTVLDVHEGHRAMLQERLGRPLGRLGLPVETQIEITVATLGPLWHRVPISSGLGTGADQARWLARFIPSVWEDLGRPCPAATVERVVELAEVRRRAFDPATAVLVHGDAHPDNVLESPGAATGFALIDPDGMISEPAHDLAIPLRDWTDHLSSAPNPTPVAMQWCSLAASLAGVEARAVWEWALVERVSTGLFMARLGNPYGRRLLALADRLAADSA